MQQLLALGEAASFASRPDTPESEGYERNLKFLQRHGVFQQTSQKFTSFLGRPEPNQPPHQAHFALHFDIATQRAAVRRLK